jgi:lysozyme
MKLRDLINRLLLVTIFIGIPMEINAKGLDIIKTSEGFSSQPYVCPAGKLTVGYGHTKGVSGSVTKEKAEELLRSDLKEAQAAVRRYVKVELTENQFSALVSFVFNVGAGNFKESSLLEHLNAGNMHAAANEITKWVYAKKKVLPGLVARRQKEKELFLA